MAVDPIRSTEDLARTDGAAAAPARPGPGADALTDDASVVEMLLFGTQEIVRGSDTGTLGAFAALAFQQIRGRGEPHHQLGCGFLLFSVLMCALVHVATGNAYFRRAKLILRESSEARRHLMIKRVSFAGALIAALVQLVFLGFGIFLVLLEKPPAVLQQLIRP
jgi:hypothetical protein